VISVRSIDRLARREQSCLRLGALKGGANAFAAPANRLDLAIPDAAMTAHARQSGQAECPLADSTGSQRLAGRGIHGPDIRASRPQGEMAMHDPHDWSKNAAPAPALSAVQIAQCAASLWQAERTRRTIAPLSDSHPGLDESQAYAIQAEALRLRGTRAVGFKLGYTSAAMRAQMNIDHPNYGVLTEDLRIEQGAGCVDAGALIHPLVEPEIALLVGRRIEGPGHDRNSIWPHVDAVLPALEVVDTRYHEYRFAIVDNISDNSSSARFLTGTPRSLASIEDLRLLGVLLWTQGRNVEQGVAANALGDPLLALAWLANFLAERGQAIQEGSVVLTGGLTRAHPAARGQSVLAEFARLGSVRLHFS
jgi:2-keto-4-pentenoate hydratase